MFWDPQATHGRWAGASHRVHHPRALETPRQSRSPYAGPYNGYGACTKFERYCGPEPMTPQPLSGPLAGPPPYRYSPELLYRGHPHPLDARYLQDHPGSAHHLHTHGVYLDHYRGRLLTETVYRNVSSVVSLSTNMSSVLISKKSFNHQSSNYHMNSQLL